MAALDQRNPRIKLRSVCPSESQTLAPAQATFLHSLRSVGPLAPKIRPPPGKPSADVPSPHISEVATAGAQLGQVESFELVTQRRVDAIGEQQSLVARERAI